MVIKPETGNSGIEKVELEFLGENGENLVYFNDKRFKVEVPVNQYTSLKLQEINFGKFIVLDLDQNSQEYRLNRLETGLTNEINDRQTSDEYLSGVINTVSTNLGILENTVINTVSVNLNTVSTDLDILEESTQDKFDSIDTAITNINTKIAGGICYKG